MRILTILGCLVAGYLANKAVDLWGVDQGVEVIVTLQAFTLLKTMRRPEYKDSVCPECGARLKVNNVGMQYTGCMHNPATPFYQGTCKHRGITASGYCVECGKHFPDKIKK